MSHTLSEYLKVIYRAYEDGIPIVGPTYLATLVGVNKATAYSALVNLRNKGYGRYIKGKGFMLNAEGLKAAKKAIRRHRLLECYLTDTLNLAPSQVCCEVSNIDAYIGDGIITALEKIYGHVQYCPCGNKIPRIEKEVR